MIGAVLIWEEGEHSEREKIHKGELTFPKTRSSVGGSGLRVSALVTTRREAFVQDPRLSTNLEGSDELWWGTYIEIGDAFSMIHWVLGRWKGVLLDGHGRSGKRETGRSICRKLGVITVSRSVRGSPTVAASDFGICKSGKPT